MNRSTALVIFAAAAAAPIAGAAVINSAVATSLTLSNSTASAFTASGLSSKQSGIADKGTLIGTFGANAGIYTCYQVQQIGAAGSGSHGGNVYSVNVIVGAAKKVGPFAQFYKDAIALWSDTLGGAAITNAAVAFGSGGGGLSFDDFGVGTTALAIETSQGDGVCTQRADPMQYADATAMQYPTAGFINADGTLGFAQAFSVNSLWQQGIDISSYFDGNLAAFNINGYSTSVFVEAYSVPAPGAVAVLAVAGLAGRRRRA